MAQFKKKEGKILILKFLTELPTGICISYFFSLIFVLCVLFYSGNGLKGFYFTNFFKLHDAHLTQSN